MPEFINPTAPVFDIKRFAIYDGVGIRTTIFFKGCSMSCTWCQNPEGRRSRYELFFNPDKCIQCNRCIPVCPVEKIRDQRINRFSDIDCAVGCDLCYRACPTEAIYRKGDEYDTRTLLDIVLKDKAFYDSSGGGITLSGGEPLMHIEFLEHLLPKMKKQGLSVYVETCGAVPWDSFIRILKWVDHFFFDIKLIDPVMHRKYTGIQNSIILENAVKLAGTGKSIIFRIPLIPSITDSDSNLRSIADFICENGLECFPVELLPYNHLAETKYNKIGINTRGIEKYFQAELKQQPRDLLLEKRNIFAEAGLDVRILSFE
jgi:pyruvate formate lyase activating enzyme